MIIILKTGKGLHSFGNNERKNQSKRKLLAKNGIAIPFFGGYARVSSVFKKKKILQNE